MANHRRRTVRVNDSPEAADASTMRARSRMRSDSDAALRKVLGKRADGWINILTGLGDPNRDKRTGAQLWYQRKTYDELALMYRSDDMAAKIIDRPAMEMVRKGFRVSVENGGEMDEDAGDALMARLDELDIKTNFYDAERFSRCYGGAGIFIGAVDKAIDASVPLDEERLEDIKFLTVLDARELYPATYYADPLSPNFGLPELYRVRPAFTATMTSPDRQKALESQRILPVVHESRILRFPGVKINRWQMREMLGWGDSVLQRVDEVIRDFQMSWHSVAYLIQDFSQAVAVMKGISEAIENGDDKSVQARLLAIEMMRSVARMVVMDEGETFERKQTPVSGLDALLDRFMTRLAAAADMPVTLLAGEAPAGLNATGAADIRWFYDRISSLQEWKHLPPIRRLVKLLCKAKKGPTKGAEPEKLDIEFNPLWQLTGLEEAQRRLAIAQTDHIYMQDQAVDPAEVAIARFGGPRYSPDLTIDVEARRAFLEANPPGTERQLGVEGQAAAVEAAQSPEPTQPGQPVSGEAGKGGKGGKGATGTKPGAKMIAGASVAGEPSGGPSSGTGGGR